MNTRKFRILSIVALTTLCVSTAFATPLPPPSVPDAGSTAGLLALAVGGLSFVTGFLNRNRK